MSELMCSECKKCDGDRCTYFDNDMDRESTIACILFEPKKPTLFDRITKSPKVLAEKLVYCEEPERFCENASWRSVLLGKVSYAKKAEAIAATKDKLNEEIVK